MTNKLCISFDRTLGSRCREFESPHSDHKNQKSIGSSGFYLSDGKRFEIQMKDSGGVLLAASSMAATPYVMPKA